MRGRITCWYLVAAVLAADAGTRGVLDASHRTRVLTQRVLAAIRWKENRLKTEEEEIVTRSMGS